MDSTECAKGWFLVHALPMIPPLFSLLMGSHGVSVAQSTADNIHEQLAEADLATQARLTAAQVAQNIQAGSKNAAEQFNRFIEDTGSNTHSSHIATRSRKPAQPEHKDFWDSFGSPVGEEGGGAKGGTGARGGISGGSGRNSPVTRGRASPAPAGRPSAVGTAAMRKGPKEKEEDKWEEF